MAEKLLYLVTYRIEEFFANDKKPEVRLIKILYQVNNEEEVKDKIDEYLKQWLRHDKAWKEKHIIIIFDFRCLTYQLNVYGLVIINNFGEHL